MNFLNKKQNTMNNRYSMKNYNCKTFWINNPKKSKVKNNIRLRKKIRGAKTGRRACRCNRLRSGETKGIN